MLDILISCRIQQRRLPSNTACSRQSHHVAPCSQCNTQHVQESPSTGAEIPFWAPYPGPILSDPSEWVPSAAHAQLHLCRAHNHQFHFAGEGEETEGSSVYSEGKDRAMGRMRMKYLGGLRPKQVEGFVSLRWTEKQKCFHIFILLAV